MTPISLSRAKCYFTSVPLSFQPLYFCETPPILHCISDANTCPRNSTCTPEGGGRSGDGRTGGGVPTLGGCREKDAILNRNIDFKVNYNVVMQVLLWTCDIQSLRGYFKKKLLIIELICFPFDAFQARSFL